MQKRRDPNNRIAPLCNWKVIPKGIAYRILSTCFQITTPVAVWKQQRSLLLCPLAVLNPVLLNPSVALRRGSHSTDLSQAAHWTEVQGNSGIQSELALPTV
jgi:hypothetical protein